MSYLQIYIDLDNDAFSDEEGCGEEIARILKGVAAHYRSISRSDLEGYDLTLQDINGNNVGYTSGEVDEEEEETEDEDES